MHKRSAGDTERSAPVGSVGGNGYNGQWQISVEGGTVDDKEENGHGITYFPGVG